MTTSVKITTNLRQEAEVTAEAVVVAMKVVAVAEAELLTSTVPSEEAINAAVAEEAAVEVISMERSAHTADVTSMPHRATTAALVTGETKRRQLLHHQLSKKRLHPTNHAHKQKAVGVISVEAEVISVEAEVISVETEVISVVTAVIGAVVE